MVIDVAGKEAIFLGIDPGRSGGVAAIYPDGRVLCTHDFDKTEADIYQLLYGLTQFHHPTAFLEKVSAMPKQGVASMFAFGRNYGFVRGLLTALQIPYDDVIPRKWQAEFGLVVPRKPKLSQKEKKERNKQKAQQLFPKEKITHANSDALLIAEYLRRKACQQLAA